MSMLNKDFKKKILELKRTKLLDDKFLDLAILESV